MTTREVGLIERLREPDSHDPECPFNERCYCADGAPHDNVQDDIRLEAADALTALSSEREILREALTEARSAIAGLDEDALGEVTTSYDRHGNPKTGYPIRDELLAKIDAALTGVTGG